MSQAAGDDSSIVVTNLAGEADSCLAASAATTAANTVRLVTALSSDQMLAPGKYELGNGWKAAFARADGTCTMADEEGATDGTLEIDSVNGAVRGIADVTFPAGRIIASFAASSCRPVGTSSCTAYAACPAGQWRRPDASSRSLRRRPVTYCGAV